MSYYDNIIEMRSPGISYEPEDNKNGIETLNARNNLQTIFFREVAKCPRLNSREESGIGEKMKKLKIREMSWIEKISQLDFECQTASSELNRTLNSIKTAKNPEKLNEYKDKLLQLVKKFDRKKLEEYWSSLENVKNEINKLADTLVVSHLRLVIYLAKKYKNCGLDFLDLIQEGNVGLIKATQCWEYQVNIRFSTYATWWIRRMMFRALSQQSQTIRRPEYLEDRIKKMTKARSKLKQNLEKEPSSKEIAKDMNLSLRKIENVFKSPTLKFISLSTPINGGDSELGIMIEDKKFRNPFEKTVDREIKEEVKKILAILSPKERNIIELRFGIGEGNYDHTLEDIGQVFHFTRERTRQIENNILSKIRHPLERLLQYSL
jgi:RNA polymerase primary sigma factor